MKNRLFLALPLILLILSSWGFIPESGQVSGAQAQDLGFRLVGTVVTDGDPAVNFAILLILSTGSQRAFLEGDRVGEIWIKKIMPGSIVVQTGRGEERISLTSGGSGKTTPQGPKPGKLDRGEVNATIRDYSDLMQEIRVRARFEAGHPAGFVIYKIEEGSIFAQMGLQDGDNIVAVNGNAFDSTQPVVDFYSYLKLGGTVALDVRRGETKQQLHFEIR